MRNIVVIRSQFSTRHHTSDVMTCAKLSPDSITTNIEQEELSQGFNHELINCQQNVPYAHIQCMRWWWNWPPSHMIYIYVVWHVSIHCVICRKGKQYEWYWSAQVQFYKNIWLKCKDKSTSYQFKLSCACCGLVQVNFTLTHQGNITGIRKFL